MGVELEVMLDRAGEAGLLWKLAMEEGLSTRCLWTSKADAKSEAKFDSLSILSISTATDSGTSLCQFAGVTGDCNAG